MIKDILVLDTRRTHSGRRLVGPDRKPEDTIYPCSVNLSVISTISIVTATTCTSLVDSSASIKYVTDGIRTLIKSTDAFPRVVSSSFAQEQQNMTAVTDVVDKEFDVVIAGGGVRLISIFAEAILIPHTDGRPCISFASYRRSLHFCCCYRSWPGQC